MAVLDIYKSSDKATVLLNTLQISYAAWVKLPIEASRAFHPAAFVVPLQLILQKGLIDDIMKGGNQYDLLGKWQTFANSIEEAKEAFKKWSQDYFGAGENSVVRQISVDGGTGPYTETMTVSRSQGSTISFEARLDNNIGFKSDAEGEGAFPNGESSFDMSVTVQIGSTQSSSRTSFTKTAFTIEDNDPLDKILMEVLQDPVFGTPVFRPVGGRSSCPYEGFPFDPVQKPQITLLSLPELPVDEKDERGWEFTLQLSNDQLPVTTPKDVTVGSGFYLIPDLASMNGLKLSNFGSVIGIHNYIYFPLDSETPVEYTMSVFRGPLAFEYALTLSLFSSCEYDLSRDAETGQFSIINSSITLYPTFLRPCFPAVWGAHQTGIPDIVRVGGLPTTLSVSAVLDLKLFLIHL